MTQLVWFRNDLRTLDNRALSAACASGGDVRALYIATPAQWDEHGMATVRRRYLQRAVAALGEGLADLGIELDVLVTPRFGDIPALLDKYCHGHGVAALHASREYLLNEMDRDDKVAERLRIPCQFHSDGVLFEPGSISTASDKPYQVFTPFARTCRARLQAQAPHPLPRPAARAAPLAPPTITDFSAESHHDLSPWPADEEAALTVLRAFCRNDVARYRQQRDFPALSATSRLSPTLAIGLLSPRQCLARLLAEQGDAVWDTRSGAGAWLNELLWREFYRHVAHQFPRVVRGAAFKADTDRIRWNNDASAFRDWCDGQTGFPIVDAAMRQLRETGWMHNRLRMIVASFLVKDLHIDWRWGERYFMEQLIDGDFAANNGGWQWAASTGTDAAPWFRVFNPTTQSERFDPQGDFIRQYVPELRHIEAAAIHQPPPVDNYPRPIVDHRLARETALTLFRNVAR